MKITNGHPARAGPVYQAEYVKSQNFHTFDFSNEKK